MSYHSSKRVKPYIPDAVSLPEITVKVIILSIILAVILAASNCYLALKIGTTISASIPASVLAIGILRFFKNSSILESTMIQTAASAGEGVAAAISFVLPAMILLHFWQGFPYLETAAITMVGGLLGVLFSIPLRRVLLNLPDLRFPEGTAVGKLLTVCAEGGGSLKLLTLGAVAGACVAFFQAGLQVIADSMPLWFSFNGTVAGVTLGFEPATLAAGYIIGIEVGMSLLVGIVVGWMIIIPGLFFVLSPAVDTTSFATIYDAVISMWLSHLRFVGVGVMFIGGVWTLIRLIKPVLKGLSVTAASFSSGGTVDHEIGRTDYDIPIRWVALGIAMLAALSLFLVSHFLKAQHLHGSLLFQSIVVIVAVLLILLIGFALSAVCGYFTGLVGSTNNPLSGILIISLIVVGIIFLLLYGKEVAKHSADLAGLLVLLVTVIATSASISNENIQDLKAGQMIGTTPWKQQLVLMLGVVVSSLVVAPILELLFNAYGMGGVFPHPGMAKSAMLPAPQAGLIGAVAQGIITRDLPWDMIGLGLGLGCAFILFDEFLKTKGRRLPVLAVGLGIYLPMDVLAPIVIGSVVSYLVNRKKRQRLGLKAIGNEHDHDSILLACGLVAGAALMGVVLAIPFVIMGGANALRIMPHFLDPLAGFFGILSVVALSYWLYNTALKGK